MDNDERQNLLSQIEALSDLYHQERKRANELQALLLANGPVTLQREQPPAEPPAFHGGFEWRETPPEPSGKHGDWYPKRGDDE